MTMTTLERIMQHLQALPAPAQQEVLDFVEFLRQRMVTEENALWSRFSLASAMRGMEAEEVEYTDADIKEFFH